MGLFGGSFVAFMLLNLLEITVATGIGKVFLNLPSQNSSDIYSIYEHEVSGSIPVRVDIIPTDTPYENAVQISCEINPNTTGYTQVSTDPIIIDVNKVGPQGNVPFSIISAGRETSLQCWGESVNFTAIDLGGGNFTLPQFSKRTSNSDPSLIVVRRSPTLHFCEDLISLTEDVGTIRLELSDPVEDNNVSVSCSITSRTTPTESSSLTPNSTENVVVPLNLTLTDQLALINSREVEIPYQIIAGTPGTSVDLLCIAQSMNSGTQYASVQATGKLRMPTGQVTFQPKVTESTKPKITTFLVLSEKVTKRPVKFTCKVQLVSDSAEARKVANEPYCESAQTSALPLATEEPSTVENTTVTEVTTVATVTNITTTNTADNTTVAVSTIATNVTELNITTVSPTTIESNATVVASANTSIEPNATTAAGINTTIDPNATTAAGINTTMDPNATTAAGINTTMDPNATTAVGINTTIDPNATTAVPVTTQSFTPGNITTDLNATTQAPNTTQAVVTTQAAVDTTTLADTTITADLTTTATDTTPDTTTTGAVVSTETTPPPSDTTVSPAATTADTTTDGASTTPGTSPVTTPAGNTTGNGSDIPWELGQEEIEFQPSDTFKEVEITRRELPQSAVQEMVVLTCCAPATEANNMYRGKFADMLAVVQLSPNMPVNWTGATAATDVNVETRLTNPAYVEVSSCSCDLTVNHCDTDCCCDNDCDDTDKGRFSSCIPGIFGGSAGDIKDRSCYSPRINKEDWFPFLCVETENSAILGEYFDVDVSGLRSPTDVKVAMAPYENSYSFEETSNQVFEDSRLVGYREGLSLRTGIRSDRNSPISSLGYLGLPERTLTGDCVDSSPVRFLQDRSSSCVKQITKEMCQDGGVLSARSYATSTALTNPPCPYRPTLLRQQSTGSLNTEVTSHYFCITSMTNYMNSMEEASDFYKPSTKSLFSHFIPRDDNCTDPDVCILNSTYPSSSENTVEYTRCAWDDGYTLPPGPTYNEATSTCENAVVNVTYEFTWDGSEIVLLNASYILGNIPLMQTRTGSRTVTYTIKEPDTYELVNITESVLNTTSNTFYNVTETVNRTIPGDYVQNTDLQEISSRETTVLTQYFDVKFIHNYGASNNTDNSSQAIPVKSRSGNPGYNIGKPVFSGVPVNYSDGTTFRYMDSNVSESLSVWKPGPTGLCHTASSSVITFGEDTTSGCILRLGLKELQDCSYLKNLVLNRQQAIMPSLYVAKGGSPDRGYINDWVEIFRTDITEPSPTPTPEINITTDSPTTQQSTTATTDLNVTTNDTVTAGNFDDNITINYNLFSQLSGVCSGVPSGIHLLVMYAEAGIVNDQPVHEIVSAKVSYSYSTWQVSCSAGNNPNCYGNTSDLYGNETVGNFLVTSSVQFIKVPASPPVSVIRYWDGYDASLCEQESCWNQMLYPLTHAFIGDPRIYNVGFTMLAILFSTGLYMISRPWT